MNAPAQHRSRAQQNDESRRVLPWLLAAVAILVVLVNSVRSVPGPPTPPLPYFDKVMHLLYFGLIATLLLRLPPLRARAMGPAWAVLGAVGTGVTDELLQSLSMYRTTDVLDGVFNLLGASIAVCCYRFMPWYRNLLETRLL